MAYINLLPWREDALKAQQKKFFSVLSLVALFSCAITLSVSFFYQAKIDGQKTKNNFLKNEVQLLDIRINEIQQLKLKNW